MHRPLHPPLVLAATLAAALAAAQAPGGFRAQPASGQERPESEGDAERDAAADQERVEKLFELARSGRTLVRPQAAAKLAELGAPAAARVAAAAGTSNTELAALGKDLVGVLGSLADADLRARAWRALDDRDFPWRPAASRTLAETAQDAERERFVALADDPLAAVREAAIVALGTLDARDARALVHAHLADPNDRVRRAAAAQLAAWGEPEALALHIAELDRTDRFFDLDTGGIARLEALATLRERLGDDFGYRPDLPPDASENRAARAELVAALDALRGERPELELPPVARPASDAAHDSAGAPAVLGLELRSCRRGEFFLRWTADDRLLVGIGHPLVVALPEGTVADLAADADQRIAALDDARFWGEPGCDSEVYHRRPLDAERTRVLELSKGPEADEDLRPEPLDALVRGLVATLPDEPDADPRLDRLASRVRAALEVLGGDPGSG